MIAGYTDSIRRWAAEHRHAGQLENADGVGEVGLARGEAGSRLAARFTLRVDGGQVSEIRYQVFGCGFSHAACAAAADLAQGRTLQQAAGIDAERIDHHLGGLPEERRYCGDLAAAALQAAVQSVGSEDRQVSHSVPAAKEHGPKLTADDPVYRSLVTSPNPGGIDPRDRHLFACLLAVVASEPVAPAAALGLTAAELEDLLASLFPQVVLAKLIPPTKTPEPAPEINPEVRQLLLDYALDDGGPHAVRLAKILAARAAHPGHLWVAMGLFARPELSATIERQLPALFAANSRKMRWKRFLFKQVCEQNGGRLCKTPNCGDCSDYELCFAPEEE